VDNRSVMFRMRCTERCKARAAREAVSLSEYLRTELHRVAECPTPDELPERFSLAQTRTDLGDQCQRVRAVRNEPA
jgi:hypothetical protein